MGRFWAVLAAIGYFAYAMAHRSGIPLEGSLGTTVKLLQTVGAALFIAVGVVIRRVGSHLWSSHRY